MEFFRILHSNVNFRRFLLNSAILHIVCHRVHYLLGRVHYLLAFVGRVGCPAGRGGCAVVWMIKIKFEMKIGPNLAKRASCYNYVLLQVVFVLLQVGLVVLQVVLVVLQFVLVVIW